VSSVSPVRQDRPSEVVAGLISAASIFVSLAAIAYRPLRLVPVSILLALVATAMGGRHARLAAFAVAIGGVAFVLGLTVAVLTEHPLW
jgi:hypothetical protein